MSERITIEAEPREIVKGGAKKLRRRGWVPGVIYGTGQHRHVKIEHAPLHKVLRTVGTTQLLNVDVNGDTHTVLVRDIQQHLTRGSLIHVDFFEVDLAATITATAELAPIGAAEITGEGVGTATMALRSVDIEARPGDLIAEIEVDLSLIKTGEDVIYVSDLTVPEGVTILTDPQTAVARFEYITEEEEEEEEELLFAPAADSVEVIGEEPDEEEEWEEEEASE